MNTVFGILSLLMLLACMNFNEQRVTINAMQNRLDQILEGVVPTYEIEKFLGEEKVLAQGASQ